MQDERRGMWGAAGAGLWTLVVACGRSPEPTRTDASDGAMRPADAAAPRASAAAVPAGDAADLADAADAAGDGSPGDGGAFAELRRGTFIARGVWGVHSTGNLRIRIEEARCVATYGAEGSYFCGSTHELDCKLGEDRRSAVVTERSCVVHCTSNGCAGDPEGTASCTRPCYAASAGIHGALRFTANGEAFFFLDAKVVLSRKRWSSVDRLVVREDTRAPK